MSSLAAARADNFYYPPDHDPRKGSRNTQLGQHHLRERAARLASEGILVVRFELPFTCFCGGCGRALGQGLRFNADKKQVGSYHSTKVWEFRMSVPCCGTRLVVRTDPKNGDFEVVSGGRRRVVTKRDESESEEEDEGEGGDEAGPSHSAAARAAKSDAFASAEAAFRDQRRSFSSSRKALTVAEQRLRLREISELRAATHARDYETNKAARALARPVRRAAVESDARRAALGLPASVRLPAEGPRERALAAAAFAAAKRKSGKAPAATSALAAAAAARRPTSFASQSIFARSNGGLKVTKKVSSITGGGGAGSNGFVTVVKKKGAPS